MSHNKQVNQLIDRLIELGWTVEKTSKMHNKATPPFPYKPIFMAGTPNDPRAVQNMKGDIKRAYRYSNLEVPKL